MFDKFRSQLSHLIAPAKNAMSLGNEFLRSGNRDTMYADWSEVRMEDRDHYTGYGYAAITKRSRIVSRVAQEFLATKEIDTPNTKEIHPYIPLIRESKLFSENDFWKNISTFLDLEGWFPLMVVRNSTANQRLFGTPLYFRLLNPYQVQRVIKQDTMEVGGYIETKRGFQREIPASMIIEIRELNPFDDEQPFAMTDAARESSFTLKQSGDHTRHKLKGDMEAPGIITTDVVLEPEKFKNFVSRIKGKQRGEPIFGNGAGSIQYTAMDSDLSKSGLKDINEIERQKLFAVTGMSKTLMGIEESGTTRETSNTQKELFTENEAVPRVTTILDALNLDYKNRYAKEYESKKIMLSLNNPIESDQDIEVKKAEAKTNNFKLFDQVVGAGYGEDIAGKFVKGEIGIDELGKPTGERRPDPKVSLLKAQDEEPVKKKKEWRHLNATQSGVIQDQESYLQNAIVNIEGQLAANAVTRIPSKVKNDINKESDVITKQEKEEALNELILVLTAFYGIVMTIQGNETIQDRLEMYGGTAKFLIDKITKQGIEKTAQAVAESHIQTVVDDIYKVAREEALKGKGQREIIGAIKEKYAHDITDGRARVIARTETNRAFTMAQYDADRQFIKQNNLQERAYKQYHTRSANPCEFCKALEAEGKVPFDAPFVKKGGAVKAKVDGKETEYKVTFESVYAGNLHPNCSCDYTLTITNEK